MPSWPAAVLFDFDGVIVNSEPVHLRAFQLAAATESIALTDDQYYRELALASRTRRTTSLVAYALQGFVDGIRDQIDRVRQQQFNVTWINYVHETMNQFPASQTRDRQRSLVLAMPQDQIFPKDELWRFLLQP